MRLAPGSPRPVALREIVRRFWPYAAPRRRWLLLTALLALVGPALTTAEIWLFKVVVDDVLIPRDFGGFPRIAGLYVALAALEALVGGTERMLSTWLSQRFLIDLRLDLLRHLQSLSLDFYRRSRLGDLLSRVSGDVSAIETFLVSGTGDSLTLVLQVVLFTGALVVLQWQLALVSVVVAPLFWFASRFFSVRLKQVSRDRQRLSGSINAVVEQVLSNIALVQAYDQGGRELDRFAGQAGAKYAAEMRAARLRSLYTPTVDLIELAGILTVLGAGSYLLSEDRLTVGGLLAFLTYLSRLYSPIRGLGSLVTAAYSASAGAERVLELFDEQPLVADRPEAIDLGAAAGRLSVEGVRYRYPGADRPALDDVSMHVCPGQVLAVVGASGAGKSTLARLLVRFCAPDEGAVRLDGHDLRDLGQACIRRNIAVVLQEALVIDGTVADNIAYGRPDATAEQIVAAAEAAGAHGFVSAMPDRYDTRVGERGRRLSGGQAQRLAIARAMLRDAPVLLLDEPTTGLDADAVDRLAPPLRRLMAGRATVVISHNLHFTRTATEIVVLDEGRVVERGTHLALLRRRGRYADLWRLSGHDTQAAHVPRLVEPTGPLFSDEQPA